MSRVSWSKEQIAGTIAGANLFGEDKIEGLSRSDKMRASRKATTELTAWAIDYLNKTGVFQCHRSNNFPGQRITKKPIVIDAFDKFGKPIQIKYEKVEIHFKSNNITESILDISGFRIDGIHLEIEVKTGKDSLSDGQKKRISDIQKAGGISFMFNNKETFLLQIEKYMIQRPYAF